MTTAARIRVPLTKAMVEMIDEMAPSDRDAIRSAAAETIAVIEETPRSGWIPLAVQLALVEQVDAHLGRPGYYDFCQRHFSRTVDQPLVRGIFDGAVRLFGMGPQAVFKVFRRSWSMISCDAGDVTLAKLDPTDLRINVTSLPLAERNFELFVEGFAATFTGVIRLFGIDGKVELMNVDRERSTAEYRGRWTPK